MLYTERPICFNPVIAVSIGLNEAIVLQQIFALSQPDGCIGGTFKQWCEIFPFWCERTIKGIFATLTEAGFLTTCQMENQNEGIFYSVNAKKIEQFTNTDEKAILYQGSANFARPSIYNIYINNIESISSKERNTFNIFIKDTIDTQLKAELCPPPQVPSAPPSRKKSATRDLVLFFAEKVGIEERLINWAKEGRFAKAILATVSMEEAQLAIMNALSDPFWKETLIKFKTIATIEKRLSVFLATEKQERTNCVDSENPYFVILPNGNREPKATCEFIDGKWVLQ